MQKKIWLIIAVVFLICGMGLFVFGMQNLGWDFIKLSTSKYETHTYDIAEDFGSIQIDISTADIVFYPSKDGKCKVECRENEKLKNDVSVIDNTLTVKENDDRNWYDYIGFNIGSAKISVYIPEKVYNSLDVNVATGEIMIENLTADTIKIKNSTGDIDLNLIRCKNFLSEGSTGDIKLKNVIADDKLSLKRSTGDVEFKGLDAAKIDIKTNTGSVLGTVLSDKIFVAESNTGTVKVPKTTSGGKCKVKTNTGDIKITIE